MWIDPNKVINVIAAVVGSALIGYGTGSLAVGIGVFCVAFALLPSD